MPYDPSDVRSGLKSAEAAPPGEVAAAEYVKFYELSPALDADGSTTWFARGQNFVLGYVEFAGQYRFERAGQPDEYAVLLPDRETTATATANGESLAVTGQTLLFVPPGDSSLEFSGGGRVILLLSDQAKDLCALAANASSYEQRHPNVAPLEPWPAPPAGFRLRAYRLDVPGLSNPPYRIFRCTTFMINYTDARPRRDTSKMSPHQHADFEQCSLVLHGEFVHHVRWPWGTDKSQWRADEHEYCAAPSVCVIPPPATHTSQAMRLSGNHLIDIFAPPRHDFSSMPGWVLNAADYPGPPGLERA